MVNTVIRKFEQKVVIPLFPGLEWLFEFRNANKEVRLRGGIATQLWAWHKGFYLESVKLCGITRANVNEYLSDKAYLKLHPINNIYSAIIDNKLYLPFLLKDYPDLAPIYYYVIDKGRLVNIAPVISVDHGLLQLCKEKLNLALKPCTSTMGHGFYRLQWKNEKFLLNNQPVEVSELESLIDSLDGYLVTEYIIQNQYAAEINQSSVNTIRLICVRDSFNNKFFIPTANHRFGTEGRVVDNIGAEGGAMAAFIDISTGRLKNIGIVKENGIVKKTLNVIIHPESKKQITNTVIPHWPEMVSKVLSVLNHLSFLKFVGLDIVITENGFKIIEINSLPTLMGIQMEEGVLRDERLKRFFLDK